jgi:hypothetical protein
VIKNYSIEWRRPVLDIAELVRKRYLEKWKVKELSRHFGRTEDAIKTCYQHQRQSGFSNKRIPTDLRKKLLEITSPLKG